MPDALNIIPLGYPAEDPAVKNKWNPAKIHADRWWCDRSAKVINYDAIDDSKNISYNTPYRRYCRMYMSERQIISITEANQNFSAVARKVDERKKVVVFKNNQPKYVVYSIESVPMELSNDEIIDIAAKRVLKRYHKAFEELAK